MEHERHCIQLVGGGKQACRGIGRLVLHARDECLAGGGPRQAKPVAEVDRLPAEARGELLDTVVVELAQPHFNE